jgi:hypothetical protein
MQDARLAATRIRKDGKPRAEMLDIPKYINLINDFFVKEGFTEREIGHYQTIRKRRPRLFFLRIDACRQKNIGAGRQQSPDFLGRHARVNFGCNWDEECPDNPIPKEFFIKNKGK